MRVLAVSTHPDDETLGCGGTLLRHVAQGDEVFWLIVTRVQPPQVSEDVIQAKAHEIDAVANAYQMIERCQLDFLPSRLDTAPIGDVIDGIRGFVDKVQPQVVYVVNGGDVHTDHQVVFTATMSVLRPAYMRRFSTERVLAYETVSSTEAAPPQSEPFFRPTVFHDITPHLERKLEVMAMYETEAQSDPMPRGPGAIRALARFRGATIGVEYAEALMLIREVG